MSNMIPMPPRQIQVGGPGGPGGPGAPPMGPGGPPPGAGGPGGGSDGPDSEKVKQLLSQARDLIDQAESAEGDDADRVMISELSHKITAFIGAQQKNIDSAMGAGPGVKLVRKNAPAPGPSGL
jgi:hypothetical protein